MGAYILLLLIPLLIGAVGSILARNVTGFLLITLLVLTPLHNWPLLPRELMGVTGLSAYNVVWFVTIAGIMGRLFISNDSIRLEKFLTGAALLFALAYGFCVFWAVIDIDAYPKVGRVAITRNSLIVENLFKPIQYVMVAWAVFAYSRLSHSTRIATAGILLAGACFGLVIFVGFTSAVSFTSVGTESLYRGREALSGGIGMHANSVGAISSYALVFAALVRPKDRIIVILRYAALIAAVLGIFLSFSRSAWAATLIVGLLLFFRLSGRERTVLLAIVGIMFVLLASAIIERATYRLDTWSASEISAGRIEKIWIPLLPEVVEHPLLGNGKFAILKSEGFRQRAWGQMILKTPHSAYLEIILDMGLLGAVVFLIFYAQMYRRAARLQHPLVLQLVIIAIVGITGHSFYPYLGNYLLWVTYGLMAAHPPALETPESHRDRTASGWGKVRLAGGGVTSGFRIHKAPMESEGRPGKS